MGHNLSASYSHMMVYGWQDALTCLLSLAQGPCEIGGHCLLFTPFSKRNWDPMRLGYLLNLNSVINSCYESIVPSLCSALCKPLETQWEMRNRPCSTGPQSQAQKKKQVNKVDRVKTYRTATSGLSPPLYSLKSDVFKALHPHSSTLPAMFSILLQVLGKYWHYLLRNLSTDRSFYAEKIQWRSYREGIGRAVFPALLRNACCFWKCQLASWPYVRWNDNSSKAVCLPWRRKELAFGLRHKGRDPKRAVVFLVRLE